ncbi:MAG TPA: response regulator [Pyrinomonadaceae bacterium]|nr:response regulator [Pyrinomonadaceae bacterium]
MNRNKTVLVISDNPEQFIATAALLRGDGYCVRFEKEMCDGLSLGNADAPYLMISELAGPNVDGLQLCRRVRDDRNLETVPVILVGDLSEQSSIVRDSFRCGAAGYVQKPVDAIELADKCRRLLTPMEYTLIDSSVPPDHASNVSHPISAPRRNVVSLEKIIANDTLRTLIFDNASIGVGLFHWTGQLIEGNRALMRLLGYSESELRKLTIFDFICPQDDGNDKQTLEAVILGEQRHYRSKYGYLTRQGERVRGTLTIVNIPAPEKDTHYLVCLFEGTPKQCPNKPAAPANKAAFFDHKTWKIDENLICVN